MYSPPLEVRHKVDTAAKAYSFVAAFLCGVIFKRIFAEKFTLVGSVIKTVT